MVVGLLPVRECRAEFGRSDTNWLWLVGAFGERKLSFNIFYSHCLRNYTKDKFQKSTIREVWVSFTIRWDVLPEDL